MLTQAEADALIKMNKLFVESVTISLPPGTDQTHELIGEENKEHFLLDLWRGTILLSKLRYQTRGRKVIVLVRLDTNGAPHTNPDGTRIEDSHIHLYREGFEDKWAQPIDSAIFKNILDLQETFENFCHYCNIINIPLFQREIQ